MTDTTETRWFKIIVFVASGFFAGLFLADIIYFNRLRNGGTITNGEAVAMLWLNAILFIIAIIIFIWALIRLLTTTETRAAVQEKVTTYLNQPGPVYPVQTQPVAVQVQPVAIQTQPVAVQTQPVPLQVSSPTFVSTSNPQYAAVTSNAPLPAPLTVSR
jgi:hypothetical protein